MGKDYRFLIRELFYFLLSCHLLQAQSFLDVSFFKNFDLIAVIYIFIAFINLCRFKTNS